MEVTPHQAIEIAEASAVGEVRRRAQTLASEAGLDPSRVSDVALVATEAASNVVKHGGLGGALVGIVDGGVSLVVWDRGPGMDVARCLRDGMSTAGTAGKGLGAISRLASRWDVFSAPGYGTVLTASMLPANARRDTVDVGGVSTPIQGEIACGDGWDVQVDDHAVTAIVCDGLGHGPAAAEAAAAVIGAFQRNVGEPPVEHLARADRAARGTRGAAATVVRIDRATRAVVTSGVGNVAAYLWGDGRLRPMVTQHGTLGQATPRLREETYALPPSGAVILCTDGLQSRLGLDAYPGLAARGSATIAATLLRDFSRGRDDATAVVIRLEPPP